MIVSCGEALVDLMPERRGAELIYRPVLGGSAVNVALGIARLGGRSAYLWELSTDALGCDFMAALEAGGVDRAAVRRGERATPVAIVDLSGEEPVYNIADPGRVMHDTVPPPLPASAACLVIGSAVLSHEPVADAIEALAATSVLLAIDYNVRRPSIGDVVRYRARLERLSRRSGIAKASVADLAMLGIDDADRYMRGLVEHGAGMAVLTRGAAGSSVWTAAGEAHLPAPRVPLVDAVGAGDAFMAALLAGLQAGDALAATIISTMTGPHLTRHLAYAQAAAAVSCARRGAVMPTAADIRIPAVVGDGG